jgi:hypothetical protein
MAQSMDIQARNTLYQLRVFRLVVVQQFLQT